MGSEEKVIHQMVTIAQNGQEIRTVWRKEVGEVRTNAHSKVKRWVDK